MEQKKELLRALPAATPNCLILQFKEAPQIPSEWRLVNLQEVVDKGLVDEVLDFELAGDAIVWGTGFRISGEILYKHSQPMTPKFGVDPTDDPTRFRLTITEDLPGALH